MVGGDEITEVDIRNPLVAAMVFLAAVAYPESHSERDRAIDAMRALLVRACLARALPTGDYGDLLARMPNQQQDGTLRRLSTRLHWRITMANCAGRLLSRTRKIVGYTRATPSEQKRRRDALLRAGTSLQQATRRAAILWPAAGQPYSLNDFAKQWPAGQARFKSTVWAPEVLHLAMALRSEIVRGAASIGVVGLLRNPHWAPRAIERAESFWLNMRRASNLPPALVGFKRARLVRIVPTVEISEPGN
jgi:hypothetical protein